MMDLKTAVRLAKKMAGEFRVQLEQGLPKAGDKAELLRLRDQLRAGKVCVKLHCRHALHAKLY